MDLFDQLEIKTETTGFASPAETYVDKRLDLNDLIVGDVYSTFYFRYSGESQYGVYPGDVLVIDRSSETELGDLIVTSTKVGFKISQFTGVEEVFGRVNWVLSKR